ncbi:MAG: alpha-glucuronidase [Clostridia bacterium]|nr:alpha-glucuronidase [Clostridia bacterium]
MNARCLSWLPFLSADVPGELKTPDGIARFELEQAEVKADICVREEMGESFRIEKKDAGYIVFGGETGVLYGSYRLMMALKAREEVICDHEIKPFYALRMINCWDNAEGTVERGYAGRSLFFENGWFDYDPVRMRQLARMMASVGLNVLCINNVNVHDPAHNLIEEEWLPELAKLASIFRPFGVRLMVSIDYAHPMRHGIPTADPLDENVQNWWMQQTEKVYRYIPDLAGYLVKADSEHRPGPFTYGRDHADGANMLARALKPFGGKLIWRCFVYNCLQDWRDTKTDRPMAAYIHYAHLDGRFEDNVILQIKNGPFDFQVREPVSPLFYAMPKTNLALEIQLAQEYTGHQIDIYAMPPMWKELFCDLPKERVMAIAAVSNLGRDDNYTGHPFAAVNLFSYGLTAWDPSCCDPEGMIRLWVKLTYALDEEQENLLVELLLHSRRTYEKYTAPLGLNWMVTTHEHYGPAPSGYEYAPWGTYHKANRDAVGIDRTANGTGYTEQYPEPFRSLYANLDTCPDLLKLFFHRLRYDYVMKDGRTLVQRIYDDHFEGWEEAQRMAETLEKIDLPQPDSGIVKERMLRQLKNAHEWCDIINTFFYRLSGVKDANGRTIYE